MNNIYYNQEFKHIALIGDIINSKKIDDRFSIQTKMETVLSEINNDYKDDIDSNFMITLGDEFQGLLRSPSNITSIIEIIEREMYPVKLRFGIGIGNIDTNIIRETPFGMDGPAYHNARKMLQHIKASEKKRMVSKTDIMIEIDEAPEYSKLINTIFSLTYNIKKKWKEPQVITINEYIHSGHNQEEAAAKLGITQSAVYKRLDSANYYTYVESMRNVENSLSELFKER